MGNGSHSFLPPTQAPVRAHTEDIEGGGVLVSGLSFLLVIGMIISIIDFLLIFMSFRALKMPLLWKSYSLRRVDQASNTVQKMVKKETNNTASLWNLAVW